MKTPTWDPAQYLRYAGHRLRPAIDLLSHVDLAAPQEVHDLGCGAGRVTRLMQERWPGSHVVGSDSSPEMLAEARLTPGTIEWRQLDATEWDEPPIHDVIFSNAVLHWIPDHDGLILRLLRSLEQGGVLAIQMPLSWYEPSHVLMRETMDRLDVGSAALRSAYARPSVSPPDHYLDLLAPEATAVDVWSTRYLQLLHGHDPVLEWVSGTALRPVLEELAPEELAAFLEAYAAELRAAYPPRANGTTVFPFPRLFIIGHR